MPAGETPLLEVRVGHKTVRRSPRGRRRDLRCRPRIDHGADRAERRGEVHALQRRLTGFERGDGGASASMRRSVYRPRAARDRAARNGAHVPADKGARVMSVLDNMLLAAPNPGERLMLAPLRPVWRGAERAARARAARAPRSVRTRGEGERLRRHPVGWPAQAAGARARADARASHAAARRAAGRRQPDAGTYACSSTSSGYATSVTDDPARRARHGRRDALQRHVVVMAEGRVLTDRVSRGRTTRPARDRGVPRHRGQAWRPHEWLRRATILVMRGHRGGLLRRTSRS